MTKQAFTLLEVLIMMAIILVLLSLTFPAFTGVKGRAYETSCISNMRQIYNAAQLYEADFDGPPPNNVLFPAWRPYLDHKLTVGCRAAPPGHAEREMWGDYVVNFDASAVNRAVARCSEVRQGSFPVVRDKWHLQIAFAASVGRRVVILVRRDGSASVVHAKQIETYLKDSQGFPCPDAGPYENL